jgi:hypothetical protein
MPALFFKNRPLFAFYKYLSKYSGAKQNARKQKMTLEQIKTFIQGGEWISIAPELRPSITKSTAGDINPFYCTRAFTYPPGDRFECTLINYLDATAKTPLVKFVIKGHLQWQGEHPVAPDAQKVDYIADEAYEVTPLHPGWVDAINRIPSNGLSKWQLNVPQDLKGKAFPAFGLTDAKTYVDYDLIYICGDMLFNGSKNVDGRPFNKPDNRPTNLQVPLARKN